MCENGQKVGSIRIRLDMCSITGIFVNENLRNEGRGTKLVRFAEKLALEKRCKKIFTSPVNPESIGFFEKCGYQIGSDECGEKNLLEN